MPRFHQLTRGRTKQFTAEEEIARDKEEQAWEDKSTERKLLRIKEMRLAILKETDFYALSDVTMSDAMSTYRQTLRDIPQDYSEEQYSELLARDEQGNLTHSIWSKP